MVLVDTPVWVDHLRTGDPELRALLATSKVCVHPFIVGELARGNLTCSTTTLSLLKQLPHIMLATDDEVLFFIETKRLMGRGIGYIDAHLLAATALSQPVRIWTRDQRLHAVADNLSPAF